MSCKRIGYLVMGLTFCVAVHAAQMPTGADVFEREAARAGLRFARAEVLRQAEADAGLGQKRTERLLKVEGPYPFVAEEVLREVPAVGAAQGRVLEYHSVVADHLVVRLRQGRNRAALEAACGRRGWTIRKALPVPGFYLVEISRPGMEGLRQAALELLTDDEELIQSAEADELIWADALPNDPGFSLLYGMHNTGQTGGRPDADIDAPEAWERTTGDAGMVVAVIDSGVDLGHPDLAGNLWLNPGETGLDDKGQDKRTNGMDDDQNGYADDFCGWDFYNADNLPDDDFGHGTHCAGTIGALGNNGLGVAGVCWRVSIMPLKFLGPTGSGPSSAAASAIYYAVANGAKVLSCSFGSSSYSSVMAAAIQASESHAVLVASAGNDGTDNDTSPRYPACYQNANVIAVAATDWNDSLAYFSNYGLTSVDLSAPGYYVYSTVTNGLYGYKSGTSMAAPHVSGAAALLWGAYPDASPVRVREALLAGADPVSSLAGKTVTGGRLNVNNAFGSFVFAVAGCTPASGSVTSDVPVSVVVRFSDPVRAAGLDAGGMTVNGVSAVAAELDGEGVVRFSFGASPVTSEGPQSIALAAGAVLRDADGAPSPAYSSQFYYDLLPLAVNNVLPAPGMLESSPAEIRLFFSEPVNPASVAIGNLELSAGQVVSAVVVSPEEVAYGVQIPSFDGTWTVRLHEGTLRDTHGNPCAAYEAVYLLDLPTNEFPARWSPLEPYGSRLYTNIVNGQITLPADSDGYWLRLDGTQAVSAVVVPDAGLRPRIRLTTDSGTVLGEATAAAAGRSVALPAVTVSGSSPCIIEVSEAGSGSGSYCLTAALNAAQEQEAYGGADNGTADTAVDLAAAWRKLPQAKRARRASVMGTLEQFSDWRLYNVTFSSPPHTIGSLPVTGSGSAPRQTVSTVSFGAPTVSSSVGPMTSQCLDLGTGGQIGVRVGTYGVFSRDYGDYLVSFDVVIMPPVDGLTINLDCPSVRNINFEASGAIRLWVSPYVYTIGTFTPGEVFKMEVLCDQRNDTITIWKNGQQLASKPGGGIGSITGFRFSSLYFTNQVGLDNIVVSSSDAPRVADPDCDWYKLSLTGTSPVSVALCNATQVQPVSLQLLGSDGVTVLTNVTAQSAGKQIISGIIPPPGDAYVRVSGQTPAYQLSVQEDAVFEAEPNHAPFPNSAGNAEVICARLGDSGDMTDLFTLQVEAGERLCLMTATPGDGSGEPPNTLDPSLTLYAPGNVLVAQDVQGAADGRNACVVYQAETAGTYILRASSETENGAGDLEICRSEAVVLQLVLPASEVTEGRDDQLECHVQLAAPAGAPLTVRLESSDFRRLILPASVVIPEGGSSAAFDLSVLDDSLLTGMTALRLKASAVGAFDATATLCVHDNERTTVGLTVPSTVNESAGVLVGAGCIALGQPADADITFALHVSDPSWLAVPETVVVSAGTAQACFDLGVIDNAVCDGNRTVTITAQEADLGNADATLLIYDNDINLVLTPAAGLTLREGMGLVTAAGEIFIDEVLTYDCPVHLESYAPATLLPSPATVVIPAGMTNAVFGLEVYDDSECQGRRPVEIKATLFSGNSNLVSFLVLDNDPFNFSVETVGAVQTSAVPFEVSVSCRTIDGDLADAPERTDVCFYVQSLGQPPPVLAGPSCVSATNGYWSGMQALIGRGDGVILRAETSGDMAGVSLPFELRCPQLSLSPAGLTNLFLAIGEKETCSLSVVNHGNAPLAFTLGVPDVGWLEASPSSGVVLPSETLMLDVALDAAGLVANAQVATNLLFMCNDPDAAANGIPVNLTVRGPDLRVAAVPVNGRFMMGDSFVVNYAVTNIGTTNAASSVVGFYLSRDQEVDPDDYMFDVMDYTPALAAGKGAGRSTYLTLPDESWWLGPEVFLLIQADGFEWVDEGCREDNNTCALPLAVTRDAGVIVVYPAAATNVILRTGEILVRTFAVSNAGLQSLTFSLDGLPPLGPGGQALESADGAGHTFWTVGATSATIPSFGVTQVYVLFDARTCAPGAYASGAGLFVSDDPSVPELSLPLAMGVNPLPPVMLAEPAYTVGFANEVFWAAGVGATRYDCVCLPDSGCFGADSGTSRVFGPLADATHYTFRTRAITDFPFGSATSEWSAAVGSVQLHPDSDYDQDGIPNQWECEHNMDPTVCGDVHDDLDGDGIPAWGEYFADTDPGDSASCLRLISLVPEGDGFRCVWTGGVAAMQVLETRSSLSSEAAWFPVFTNRPPTTLTNSLYLTAPGAGTPMFFRIRAFRESLP